MRLPLYALCVVAGLAFSPAVYSAREAASKPDEAVAVKFQQLEHDVPSLYLVNGLNLSTEQWKKMADLMESVVKAENRYGEKLRKLVRMRQKDVEREKDDIIGLSARKADMDPGRLDRTTRSQQVKKAQSELWALRKEHQEQMDEAADKAFQILSQGQRNIIANFVPCFIPPGDFKNPERVGQAAGDTSAVEEALRRLRKAGNTEEARQKALDRLTLYAMEKRKIKYSEEAEDGVRDELSVRLESAMKKVQDMSDADFELEKKTLAKQVLPLQNTGDDPASIRWKMTYYVLNPGIADVYRARASGAKAGETLKTGSAPAGREWLDNGRMLRTALLIKGLELTPEQAGKVLAVVKAAVSERESVEYKIQQTMQEALDKHAKLRGELAAGQPTPAAEGPAGGYHGKVRELRNKDWVKPQLGYEAELDKLLTAKQVEYLSGDLKTELRKTLKDSITDCSDEDSAKGREPAKKLLSQARRLTGSQYASDRETLCRTFVTEQSKTAGFTREGIDVEAEIKRAGEVLDKARKLDTALYAAQKDDLALELMPHRSKARPAVYGAHYMHGAPVQELSPSTKLLFSPEACDMLEKIAGKKKSNESHPDPKTVRS